MSNENNSVHIDEERRLALHGAVKNEVSKELHAEIGTQAVTLTSDERNRASAVAYQLKQKALNELTNTETAIERARGTARISQIVDYIFLLIYGIIGLEIVLEIIGGRNTNAFKSFIDGISAPLLLPFKTLVPSLTIGRFELHFSFIVALVVYAMLHTAIKGLLRVIGRRQTEL